MVTTMLAKRSMVMARRRTASFLLPVRPSVIRSTCESTMALSTMLAAPARTSGAVTTASSCAIVSKKGPQVNW